MGRDCSANKLTLRQINNDRQFVDRLAAGDVEDLLDQNNVVIQPGALSELFRAAYEPLLNLFRRYRIADAEDLVSEFFIHLKDAFRRRMYRATYEAKFSTWLFKAATNFALNFKKREERLGRHVTFISFAEVSECFRRASGSRELEFLERYVPSNFSMLSAISPFIEEEEEAGQSDLEVADADRRRLQLFAFYLIDEECRNFLQLRYAERLSYDKIVQSGQIRNKKGRPLSKGTIVNMDGKAITQLVMAYVIIGFLVGNHEPNPERKEGGKFIEERAPAARRGHVT